MKIKIILFFRIRSGGQIPSHVSDTLGGTVLYLTPHFLSSFLSLFSRCFKLLKLHSVTCFSENRAITASSSNTGRRFKKVCYFSANEGEERKDRLFNGLHASNYRFTLTFN